MRTITGVAALRRPRVASTRPTPTQTTGRTSPLYVTTRSPAAIRSTGVSPSGVAIHVPAQKHRVVTAMALLSAVVAPSNADSTKSVVTALPPLGLGVNSKASSSAETVAGAPGVTVYVPTPSCVRLGPDSTPLASVGTARLLAKS